MKRRAPRRQYKPLSMEAMEVVERRRNFENKPILKANAQKNHSPSFLRLFRANRVSPSLGSELSSRVEKVRPPLLPYFWLLGNFVWSVDELLDCSE